MHRSTTRLRAIHAMHGTTQRLGQFFVSRYIKVEDQTTRDLFNEPNDDVAALKINQWLEDNHHTEFLPAIVNR